MYNDYQVVYESNINQNYILYLILGIILLAITVFTFISLSKVFKKANRSVISAWIPIYNIMTLLEIVNMPKWYILLLLIPVVNLMFFWKIALELSYGFKRNKSFALGILLLPFIYLPILAFSDNEYMGINLIAKEGTTTVTDIPIIDEKEDKDVTVHEEQDIASRNINISIGGGVYQKDYTKDLLQADDKQLIKKEPVNLINNKPKDTSNNSFIKIVEEKKEEPKQEEVTSFKMPSMIETPKIEEKQDINPNPIPTINNNPNVVTMPKPIINEINNNQPLQKPVESSGDSAYINCPRCQTKLKKGSTVCFICGTHLQ